MGKLSVVFGTFDRLQLLRRCLVSIRLAISKVPTEIVIVDGGSTDGTLDFLQHQYDVTLIEHGALLGCVKAYNDGFKRATGDYVAYLNDDLELAQGTLEAACSHLDANPHTGIVSIPYRNPGGQPTHPTTKVNGAVYPFASFGVVRRELGEQAGWFDGFSHYYGDCYLCVVIQRMGYELYPLPMMYTAEHHNADNAVRGDQRWKADLQSSLKQDGLRWQAYGRDGHV